MIKLPLLFFAAFFPGCKSEPATISSFNESKPVFNKIEDIPVLPGFRRMPVAQGSFGEWLRSVSLKADNRVYLFDGRLKRNQSAQFAVLDISVGNKDLQQCADAVMRLRAEYLITKNDPSLISFLSTSNQELSFSKWRQGIRYKLQGQRLIEYNSGKQNTDSRKDLAEYLEVVFNYCGTYSLQRQLRRKDSIAGMMPGDVFIYGGFPGHAMLVVDVAVNAAGKKIFMLAQSYMPAQDIHLVKCPGNDDANPWYTLPEEAGEKLVTPEWTFSITNLMRW